MNMSCHLPVVKASVLAFASTDCALVSCAGLTTSKRTGGTVADAMRWSG